MNVSIKWIAPVIVLTSLISACSSSGGASPATESEDLINMTGSPVAVLQGDWTTECMAESNSILYMQHTLSATGSAVLQGFGWYSDPDCSVPQPVGLLVNGSTSQRAGVTSPTGDIVTTTLGPAQAVDFFFQVPTIDNAPIPSDLIGQPGFVQETVYDIVLVADDKLYLGDIASDPARDGSSPEARPNALDLGFVYTRVP